MHTLYLENSAKKNSAFTTNNATTKFNSSLPAQLSRPFVLSLCLIFFVASAAANKVALAAEYKLPPGHTLSFAAVNTEAHTNATVIGSIYARGPLGVYTRVRLFHNKGPLLDGKEGLQKAVDLWFDGAASDSRFNTLMWTEFVEYLKGTYLDESNMDNKLLELYAIADVAAYQNFSNQFINPTLQTGFQNFIEESIALYPERIADLRSMRLHVGPYVPSYNGMPNFQLQFGRDTADGRFINATHKSRGVGRTITDSDITTQEFERLVTVISALDNPTTPFSGKVKNSILYNEIIHDNPDEYQQGGAISESARLTTQCSGSPASRP